MVALNRQPGERLNVLLTDRGQGWAAQLPRLLEPQGVQALRADSFKSAVQILENSTIHMAVIDLVLPLESGEDVQEADSQQIPGGLKLLQVIHRLETRPRAVVVVRGRQFEQRVDDYVLAEALKFDAFSVFYQQQKCKNRN